MESVYTQTFTEQARTEQECRAKIQAKYGDGVVILNRKYVRSGGFFGFGAREGIEMTGYIPSLPAARRGNGFQGASWPGVPAADFAGLAAPERKNGLPKEPWDLEERKQKVLAAALGSSSGGAGSGAAASSARPDPALQKVLAEVLSIREKLDERTPSAEFHPSLARIDELLTENDFSPAYKNALLERVRNECPLGELGHFDLLQDKVLEWIGETVRVSVDDEKFPRKPRIMALVGPTGVGKTTTIAKLATSLGIDKRNGGHIKNIALVTIDMYKITGKEQLETYGQILQFPTFFAADYEELKKIIALNAKDVDIVLIDTIGRSPRESEEIGAMRDMLEACGSGVEVFLTLQATTKARDLREIIQRFEPFNSRSVIVTKLDETMQAGNVISALWEKSKPASYITNGQTHEDIEEASVIEFLTRLEGFTVNRHKLEERFGKAARGVG